MVAAERAGMLIGAEITRRLVKIWLDGLLYMYGGLLEGERDDAELPSRNDEGPAASRRRQAAILSDLPDC